MNLNSASFSTIRRACQGHRLAVGNLPCKYTIEILISLLVGEQNGLARLLMRDVGVMDIVPLALHSTLCRRAIPGSYGAAIQPNEHEDQMLLGAVCQRQACALHLMSAIGGKEKSQGKTGNVCFSAPLPSHRLERNANVDKRQMSAHCTLLTNGAASVPPVKRRLPVEHRSKRGRNPECPSCGPTGHRRSSERVRPEVCKLS